MSDCCGCGDETLVDAAQQPRRDTLTRAWWQDTNLVCSLAAGLLWLTGVLCEWLGVGRPALVAFVLALLAGGYTFVPSAVRRLVRQRGKNRLGVGLLMTIAAVGSVLLGHVGEAAALAFLFSISETLEEKAMQRARRGLRALLGLIPDKARVLRCTGQIEEIDAASVLPGDVLLIHAGERVPTDGVVEQGTSWVDNSAMTGESMPIEITVGDRVLAGAVNGRGVLKLRASAAGRDNSLTHIVALVQQAQAEKGQRARLADRIARWLVPLVLVVAALLVSIGFIIGAPGVWIERALVVLVAASPCALAIAVPVTVISAIGAASRLGVIIKSGAAFEELGTVRTVAFDKTGTLTRNQPTVVDVHTFPDFTREQVLEYAAALGAQSQHPLTGAMTTAAAHHPSATQVLETPGSGLQGEVLGHQVRAGNSTWLCPEDGDVVAGFAEQGMSAIVVEIDGRLAGVLAVRDELRPEVPETVADLNRLGVAAAMITGDHQRTADVLAAQAGISDVFAEQSPADKAQQVMQLRAAQPTAMVGDGINDAPALAAATVGIAMGTAATAAAMESADIAFMGNNLRQLPLALAHAQRGRRIMLTNIALALVLVAGLFPLALFGMLGLASVVFIHEIAEVVIIANGVRAARVPQHAL